MSNYTKATNFTIKDTTRDTVLGAEHDTEYTAIATAIATKADTASPTFTGTVTLPTVAGNRTDSGNITHSGTVTMSAKSMYWAKGADIASASPLVIGSDGNYFDVTGTTGFASMTVPAGMLFMLQFDGALVLTHHTTNLNLPGGANITTAAGDRLIGFATAANTVHVLEYTRATGNIVGKVGASNIESTTNSPSAVASTTFSGLSPSIRYRINFRCSRTAAVRLNIIFNADSNARYSQALSHVNTAGASSVDGSSGNTAIFIEDSSPAINEELFGYIEFESGQYTENDVEVISASKRSASSSGIFTTTRGAGKYTGVSALSSITIGVSSGTLTGTFVLVPIPG